MITTSGRSQNWAKETCSPLGMVFLFLFSCFQIWIFLGGGKLLEFALQKQHISENSQSFL
jgi:hypothetical protein